MEFRISLLTLVLMFSCFSFAADVVPYSIQSIKYKDAGFVELIGPGKILINGEAFPYDGTKYVRIINIGTLTGVEGSTKGCMIAYSSEGYTENISVLKQSCNEVLSIISKAKWNITRN